MRSLILLLLSILMAAGAYAQSVSRCEVKAYVVNPTANDLRLRSGAGNASAVVGHLASSKLDTVNIIGSNPGWIKIRSAEDEDGNVFSKKQGWIPVTHFWLSTASAPQNQGGLSYLYAGPNKKSRIIDRLKGDTPLALVGCSGKWVKVKVHRKTGWLAPESQCSNSRTTCV